MNHKMNDYLSQTNISSPVIWNNKSLTIHADYYRFDRLTGKETNYVTLILSVEGLDFPGFGNGSTRDQAVASAILDMERVIRQSTQTSEFSLIENYEKLMRHSIKQFEVASNLVEAFNLKNGE